MHAWHAGVVDARILPLIHLPFILQAISLATCPRDEAGAASPSAQQPAVSATDVTGQQEGSGRRTREVSEEGGHVRLSSRGKRFLDHWTASDVLSFFSDPSLSIQDLQVEYEKKSVRPVAW